MRAITSKYVEYYLHKLTSFIPSYVKSSFNTIERLKKLNVSDPDINITTSDTKNMYGHIDPKEGISTIQKYVDKFAREYKGFFPKKLIIRLLWLVMIYNVFKFGDT